MGKKIFVSYKYSDHNVFPLKKHTDNTVRDYVDEFEKLLDKDDHIYKGEEDNEDLSHLTEDYIWNKLKDKIYDSSITVVFISKGMRIINQEDKNQWIPWEISFSLKETTRNNITSHSNAIIAVVLPDKDNSYDYYFTEDKCGPNRVTYHKTYQLFNIIKNNKFNKKDPEIFNCNICGNKHYLGDCSYIEAVKWNVFIQNVNKYIDRAVNRQTNIDDYNIYKEI